MRYATLREIDDAELDIRVWCYECARGELLTQPYARLWDLPIAEARLRFRCKTCGSREHVLIVPARPEMVTWKREVERWFFNVRPSYKVRRR